MRVKKPNQVVSIDSFSKFKSALFATMLLCLLTLTTTYSSFAHRVKLTGFIYFDYNSNQMFDEGDVKLVNGTVNINNFDSSYFQTVRTNGEGVYYGEVPNGKCSIGVYNSNQQDFKPLPAVNKFYISETSDTINLVFQKKDSIEWVESNVRHENYLPFLNNGATATFNLVYAYAGFLHPVDASLELSFNPLVKFVSSTIMPSKIDSGKVQWDLSKVERGSNLMKVTLSFSSVGDTIDGFDLQPFFTLKTGAVSNAIVNNYKLTQLITHEFPNQGIGRTTGLKWSRPFSSLPRYSAVAIDTTGEGYLLAGLENFALSRVSTDIPFNPVIMKIGVDGLTIWEKFLKLDQNSWPEYAITKLKSLAGGGFVTLGYVSSYVRSLKRLRLCRFTDDGSLVWFKDYSLVLDFENELSCDLQVTSKGFMICGTAFDKIDSIEQFNSSNTLRRKILVASVDSTGELLWQRKYGGESNDEALKIFSLNDGSFIVSGLTQSKDGDVKFAHNHSYLRLQDGDSVFSKESWIFNISSDGDFIWSHCFGGTERSTITGCVEQSDGLIFTGYSDSNNGDLLENSTSFVPLWILKVSRRGSIIWNKIYQLYEGYKNENLLASKFYDYGAVTSPAILKDSTFVVGVRSRDQFGLLRASHGGVDIVLVDFDSNGNVLWQKALGGNNTDYLYALQIDSKQNLTVAGHTFSENDDLYGRLSDKKYPSMYVGQIGNSNFLKGNVFVDKNHNKEFDSEDIAFSEGQVIVKNLNDSGFAKISGGRYFYVVDTGTYKISFVDPNGYYNSFPEDYNFSFKEYNHNLNLPFLLEPKPGIVDLKTSIVNTGRIRPGFQTTLRIITKNLGTETISNATIQLKKPSTVSFVSAGRSTNSISPDTISFTPINMEPGKIDTLDITLKLAAPPTINNGDTLVFTAIAQPLATDTTPLNNQATLRQIVTGSYDPNDKTEAHAGVYTPTMKANNEAFQYLIRFQNTGTDTAFYVTVKDTLSDQVDLNSLEVISTSHPYTFSLDGNIATWQFDMIKLVDSTTNESKSHGFISFSIKPKEELQVGDTVGNKAAIYFDFNLPVITNVSELLMVSDQSVICPGSSTQLLAGYTGIAYQWQVNTGNGFVNISNNTQYAGTNTNALLLKSVPSSFYNYQYRCVITVSGGKTIYSNTYKLTFANTWTGTVSNAWENAANWSCGSVPDVNTDVIIKSTAIRQPQVNTTIATCRSIHANQGSHVWIKVGAKLDVKGK